MSYMNKITLCSLLLALCIFFMVIPAHAFTADSLDIIVDKNGDAIATFRFTLEGFIENSIPQSILEEELKKGLTTSSDPPELKSMDKSSAVLFLKKFADTGDVPTGTEYRTNTMDFKKAELALQNSDLGSMVSADFSPETVVLTFPDSYQREFSNVDVLPAVFHTVIDSSKTPRTTVSPAATAPSASKGSMNVTSSPMNVRVYLDSQYIGEAPSVFREISAGIHTIEFQKEGYESASKTVTIPAGKTTNVMVVLNVIPPVATEEISSLGWFWPVVIIALIAIAVGGYYYRNNKMKNEEEDEKDTEHESE